MPYHGEYIVNRAEIRDGRGRRNPVNDYPESLQLEVPTYDTHKNTNFHYPPPEAIVSLLLDSFSSFSSRLFYRSNVSLQGYTTGFSVTLVTGQGTYSNTTSFVVHYKLDCLSDSYPNRVSSSHPFGQWRSHFLRNASDCAR